MNVDDYEVEMDALVCETLFKTFNFVPHVQYYNPWIQMTCKILQTIKVRIKTFKKV